MSVTYSSYCQNQLSLRSKIKFLSRVKKIAVWELWSLFLKGGHIIQLKPARKFRSLAFCFSHLKWLMAMNVVGFKYIYRNQTKKMEQKKHFYYYYKFQKDIIKSLSFCFSLLTTEANNGNFFPNILRQRLVRLA